MATRNLTMALRGGLYAFALTATVAAHAETLRIGGTGVALGGMRMLGEAFAEDRPGTEIEVLPSLGSSGGIEALLAGAVDLAVSSRPLRDEERAAGVEGRIYARTPLAVVTRPDTAAEAITSAELEAIYGGSLTRWPDGSPIRLVLRPESETDVQILRAMSPGMEQAVDAAFARPGMVVASNDQDNAETLEQLAGSIGLVALGQIETENRNLKVLALDGVHPHAALAGDADTGFAKELILVTAPAASALARDFAAFVASADGRAVLARTGHSPVE